MWRMTWQTLCVRPYIKEYPDFKFSAMYEKYCDDKEGGDSLANPGSLSWAVNATAERFTFVQGITLEFARISAYSLRDPHTGEDIPAMVIIHAKLAIGGSMPGVDAVAAGSGAGTGGADNGTDVAAYLGEGSDVDAASAGPSFTIYAEIGGKEVPTYVRVNGNFNMWMGDGGMVAQRDQATIILEGGIEFEFPCGKGMQISASLALELKMDSIIVDGATVSATWFCVDADAPKPRGCDLPTLGHAQARDALAALAAQPGVQKADEDSPASLMEVEKCGKNAEYTAEEGRCRLNPS